ncbi:MAG: mannosyl-3-phosphoglycerate synthase [Chloroflexi bacterium]|nr:mannosyl-3-phosphoglycerate synthase [Chloroflexota bacterium]
MRLDLPRLRERLGAVLFYGLQSVYELDSGMAADEPISERWEATQRIPYELLHDNLQKMAIVVPVREEKLKLLDGVFAGIPNACQIILVSNSSRSPIDRFELERDASNSFGVYTNRPVISVHQRDPQLAKAFAEAGYTEILDDEGLVRSGKAEGMLIGTMLARLSGRETIGFIDSDNYFPGAVLEYCHLFASGFAMARAKHYAMVRISWASKPKIVENNLYFAKWGRSSIITNRFMNQLVSSYTGFETEVIRTGNAGEHAMTLDLAMNMGHSSGYSIEPYQLVYLMEQFGGVEAPEAPDSTDVIRNTVNVYQVESRNPHLHEYKGEEHVERMIEASLSVIYHSPLCPDSLKEDIRRELSERRIRAADEELPQLRKYQPLAKADQQAFRAALEGHPAETALEFAL